MAAGRNSLARAKLYLILDSEVCEYEKLFEILQRALKAGVDIIQLRDKQGSACDILRFTKDALKYIDGRIPFIVNDRLDIALAAQADGVHLGQEDLPVLKARKIAPRQLIIGASCQSLDQVLQAQKEGADYIGFGAVFKTPTKPEREGMDLSLLTEAVRIAKIPVFAIGGIRQENLPRIKAAGVKRIAVIRAICLAPDVYEATRSLLDKL